MRKFEPKKKTYFEFQIEGTKKTYKIPVAASLPINELLMIKEQDEKGNGFEAQMAMLRKYMGDEVDDFSAETVTEILRAWAAESRGEGATAGE